MIFKPFKYKATSTLSLYIKNNLTILYPIKLKGIGGKGEIIVAETRLLINRGDFNFIIAVIFVNIGVLKVFFNLLFIFMF